MLEINFVNVGECINVIGSFKFSKVILVGDYDVGFKIVC